MRHYERAFEKVIASRLNERPKFIQTILGPRQVGKTSGIRHVLEKNFKASEYAYHSCDEGLYDKDWFFQTVQNELIQRKGILVFDEIQKIENWSELVKRVWDQQKQKSKQAHLVLLGSSSLQLSQGLSESLAGRFEVIRAHHWNFMESAKAFDLNFDEFLLRGGYPGSYLVRKDESRFRQYMTDAIFESVISRDILRYSSVKKPALFRQTFALACQYPAQEISYNKLLGQLQEAGNVDQIKHYLDLFAQAFLIRSVFKWSKSPLSRTSSPKILPAAPVFTSYFLHRDLTSEEKGRVFEALVGNCLCRHFDAVYFWREGKVEVDYVVDTGQDIFAIEVKSKKRKTSGIEAFRRIQKNVRCCYIDFTNYQTFERDPISFLDEFAL